MHRIVPSLCALLTVVLIEVPFAIHAQAGMIPTGQAVSALVALENREKVERFLQREDVKREFTKFGVRAEEASLRVASMSDYELQRLAGQIDQSPAGADTIVISVTTILLVIIILLLLGKI
jgi:hypothetical protein